MEIDSPGKKHVFFLKTRMTRQFDKKAQYLQQIVLRQLHVHMQKNGIRSLLHTIHKKINSKWFTELNVRAQTIKLLEENTSDLHNLELGDGFLHKTRKAQATTKEIETGFH